MQVRFSTCIGMPVVAEDTEEVLGTVADLLLDPDRGKVEGFFITVPRFLSSGTLFLSWADIARFGRRIVVRHPSVLAAPEEFLRIGRLLDDGRTVLRQKIRTESGASLGRGKDVQFETASLTLTWVFPRRFFSWGRPIAAKEIVKVTPQAIIVKDPPGPAPVTAETAKPTLDALIPEIPEQA